MCLWCCTRRRKKKANDSVTATTAANESGRLDDDDNDNNKNENKDQSKADKHNTNEESELSGDALLRMLWVNFYLVVQYVTKKTKTQGILEAAQASMNQLNMNIKTKNQRGSRWETTSNA